VDRHDHREISRARIAPADRAAVRAFLARFKGEALEVALEATTGWRFVVEELEERLLVVVLADKRKHPLGGLGLGEHPFRGTTATASPATVPSDSVQAQPKARMTGWPFRDHFPYQNGPVERSRTKGLDVGFGLTPSCT
jgi:hypothetical protein